MHSSPRDQSPHAVAGALADDLLFPHASDVDRGRRAVSDNLDAIADAGLYGLDAPRVLGGLDADADEAAAATEALAGGCLTTAFVWIQHRGAMKRVAAGDPRLAAQLGPRMAAGELRAGVGVGGVRPGRHPVVAREADDGWTLHGTVPWITGWGLVDVLLLAARDGEEGDVLWFLVDAPSVEDPGGALRSRVPAVSVRRVPVVACDHANSAVVTLDGLPVPWQRLVARQSFAAWEAADAAGLRTNGHLAVGVATRCARLTGDPVLAAAVDDVRDRLATAGPDLLPSARAAAATLAWQAAQLLLVDRGGAGLGADAHAQRLAREATVLQAFGSRPAIRSAHLASLRRVLGGSPG